MYQIGQQLPAGLLQAVQSLDQEIYRGSQFANLLRTLNFKLVTGSALGQIIHGMRDALNWTAQVERQPQTEQGSQTQPQHQHPDDQSTKLRKQLE